MIVADTNILAYFLIEGERTATAQALWQADSRWRLPALWRHEFVNILATYVRAGGAPLADMQQIRQTADSLFTPMECDVAMSDVLELAVNHGISAYDAQFVALAQTFDVPLVSEDKRLQNRCPGTVFGMDAYLKEQ